MWSLHVCESPHTIHINASALCIVDISVRLKTSSFVFSLSLVLVWQVQFCRLCFVREMDTTLKGLHSIAAKASLNLHLGTIPVRVVSGWSCPIVIIGLNQSSYTGARTEHGNGLKG